MKTGKKTWLALGILAVLGGMGAQAATLAIKTDADVTKLESDTTWAKHDGDRHWIYSQVAASGNEIIIGEKDSATNPTINYSVYGGVSMDAQSQIATDAANNTITFNGGNFANNAKILVGGQVNAGNFNAVSNTVNIHDGTVEGSIYGGIVGARASGSAKGNMVNIDGGTINGGVVGGNVQNTVGMATGNTVNISGQATIKEKDIYGGFVGEMAASAENNSISISGGTFGKQSIAGGLKSFHQEDSTGSIINNSVVITGGTFDGANIYGGRIIKWGQENITNTGSVSGNTVSISGVTNKDSEKFGNIFGGLNYAGEASENKVAISNSTLTVGNIYGGYSNTGDVKDNVVEINGNVTATGKVYAGYTDGSGAVTGNTLIINGGTFEGDSLFAGYGKGEVSGNVLRLNGGTITGTVVAAKGGTLSNNRLEVVGDVDLTGATLSYGNGHTLAIYESSGGKDKKLEVKGLSAGKGGIISFEGLKFDDNQFTVEDSDKDVPTENEDGTQNPQGNVSWVQATKEIQINSFDVSGDELGEGTKISKTVTINGARFGTKDTDPGLAKVNIGNLNKDHVHVSDNGVYGYQISAELNNDSYVSDGTKQDADKNNSKIVIDASVKKMVLTGKYTSKDDMYANTTATGTVSTESGVLKLGSDGIESTKASTIAGAYHAGTGDATDGKVLIGKDFMTETTVYGGYSVGGNATGNTVTLASANNGKMNLVGGHSEQTGKDLSGNTLKVDGQNTVGDVSGFDTVNFSNVVIGGTALTAGKVENTSGYTVESFATGQTLEKGQKVTLVQVNNGSLGEVNSKDQAFTQGAGLVFTGTVATSKDNKQLLLTIVDGKASAGANDTARGHGTAVGFLNEGSDLVLTGISSLAADHTYGIQTFAATERSDSSYDGGFDIDGWKVIAGVGAQHQLASGDLAWGVFAERGLGNYTTDENHGSGDVEYNGGGAALRYTKASSAYAEASLRLGKLHDDVDGGLVADKAYDYDTSADYTALHVGVGKLFKGESGTWDVYGKYFYTKADGTSFTAGGQDYTFSDVKSQRIRFGARYSHEANEKLGFYYGAAWEYEFDGDVDGTVAGYALETAGFGGSTFLGEVGLNYKPQKDSRWDFELGVKGYTGERDGVSGIIRGAYHF